MDTCDLDYGPYHAVTILVMFPVSITVMNANIPCANMAPDYYSSLSLVTMSWKGVKSRWPHHEKGYCRLERCIQNYYF